MAGRFSSPEFDAESAHARNLVGARLAELRRSRGMTQGQLASALAPFGVRVQTAAVSKWEKGDSVPSAYQLFALWEQDTTGWLRRLLQSPARPLVVLGLTVPAAIVAVTMPLD